VAFDVEKTHYFTLADGSNILVSKLPDAIKDQVKIFDEIREHIVAKSFEAQVYQLAGEQKKIQLQKMLENYIEAQKTEEEDTANANTEESSKSESTNFKF